MISDIDVLILCGGRGERLKSAVGNRPKALAQIEDKAFLDILINHLTYFNFKRFILCVGYQKEKIIKHFSGNCHQIVFSIEESPLGTGGALKNAASLIGSSSFLVVNGDTFCDVDFNELIDFHANKKSIFTMALAKTQQGSDCGSILLDGSGKLLDFKEKTNQPTSLVNAGIYVMEKEIFGYMSKDAAFSLEYDFFPKIKEIGCYGYITGSELFDIGTPQSYEKAKVHFKEIISAGGNKWIKN